MKKKLDTRFPASRIKKIMQTDEDVGKIALAVPVLVSKALELFLQDLCDRTYKITLHRGVKTVSSLHLKQCVHSFNVFDFLKETVSKVPDLGGSDAGGDDRSSKRRKAVDEGNESDEELKKSKTDMTTGQSSGSSSGRGRGKGRGRGRPRGSGRGAERDSSRSDRFEDDPGTSPQHNNDNIPNDLKSSEEDLDVREQKKAVASNSSNTTTDLDVREQKEAIASNSSTTATVVRNFDLNLDLDENGDMSTAMATPTATTASADHVIKHEEYPGLPPSGMDKMGIDPLQLSVLSKRLDEEEEDYDNEDG
ncbi:DNA polymerase epsilon subunit C-like isoform X2 [Iris pallida]|uniref:DNA polymerase epsilon subunit C-like isoform X2 n=1 Tax=Iris pallida TaxID=29817 RepID=A0AAX6HTV4_IRIPA|nr:DNA polymerase epsilon subunit C-like isoform X2 [Iris pallida]